MTAEPVHRTTARVVPVNAAGEVLPAVAAVREVGG